jgi:hypothetical protein
MKKQKLKIGSITLFLFTVLFIYGCTCPCYLEQSFTNISDVRTKTTALISKANDSIKNHKKEIEEVNSVVNNAVNSNNKRKGCKDICKMWAQFKNDSTGVYDRFLSDWEKNKVLPATYIDNKKKNVNKILDEIEAAEKTVKGKKKPCN